MNFGLPIIGSNFGHISRYIEENNCGLIVDPESPAEIAYAMISLLKNKNRYTELSENGIKASEQYRWSTMEQKLLYLYNKLNPTENNK
jgi:glycosyltransferase involved in cell wall biosynthesis